MDILEPFIKFMKGQEKKPSHNLQQRIIQDFNENNQQNWQGGAWGVMSYHKLLKCLEVPKTTIRAGHKT